MVSALGQRWVIDGDDVGMGCRNNGCPLNYTARQERARGPAPPFTAVVADDDDPAQARARTHALTGHGCWQAHAWPPRHLIRAA